jgi:hypothetical protein
MLPGRDNRPVRPPYRSSYNVQDSKVHATPSTELMMVPASPTATNRAPDQATQVAAAPVKGDILARERPASRWHPVPGSHLLVWSGAAPLAAAEQGLLGVT